MWAVLWGRHFPSQASWGTWTERTRQSSLEVKQPVHRETAQLQEWFPGKAMTLIHFCPREPVGVYVSEGESTKETALKAVSPIKGNIWQKAVTRVLCQRWELWFGMTTPFLPNLWQCLSKETCSYMILLSSTNILHNSDLEFGATRGYFLFFFFFFSPQEISVVQEDLQDSEGFYELRSTLLFQGTHKTHKTFSCVCLFPFLGNKTKIISSKEIFVSFGMFFFDRTQLKS